MIKFRSSAKVTIKWKERKISFLIFYRILIIYVCLEVQPRVEDSDSKVKDINQLSGGEKTRTTLVSYYIFSVSFYHY